MKRASSLWFVIVSSVALVLSACAPVTTPAPAAPPVEAASTATTQPTEAATATAAATATPALGIGSATTRAADGMQMLYVPAGEFAMGRDDGPTDERPAHPVTLDAFWMDATEVTNAMYRKCVEAGACKPPVAKSSFQRTNYYTDSQYDAYPVITVNWDKAQAYCAWAGARLPSEAEWEKAARGTDARTYPWGEGASCGLANTNRCDYDTAAVGSRPAGRSPYGIYDMSGNMLEWTADWYDAKYYATSPSSNPTGPASGKLRVLRGGSWYAFSDEATTTWREDMDPGQQPPYVGFRCAASGLIGNVSSTALAAATPGAAAETPVPAASNPAASTAGTCTKSDIAYGQSLWAPAGDGMVNGGRLRELWFCGSAGDVIDIDIVTRQKPLGAKDIQQCLKTTFGLNKLWIYDESSSQPLIKSENVGVLASLMGFTLPHDGAYRIFISYYGNGPWCHGSVITLARR